MGIITMAVDVFDIQADKKAVATMKPAMIRLGPMPMVCTTNRAMRLCRSHFSMAMAMKKPPYMRNTIWCPYCAVTSPTFIAPNAGKTTMGSSAVAEMGITSLIHHTAIQMVTPATTVATGDRVSGPVNRIKINKNGPRTRPELCLIPCFIRM
jgi:hypothetical protein